MPRKTKPKRAKDIELKPPRRGLFTFHGMKTMPVVSTGKRTSKFSVRRMRPITEAD